jgi:hypothetical protein
MDDSQAEIIDIFDNQNVSNALSKNAFWDQIF